MIHSAASLQQIMEEEEEEDEFTGESSGSLCCSNSNIADDASSSSPTSLDLDSQTDTKNGPLYGLSSLIAQLPMRRGLSKFYMGKSQSFTSLCDAGSVDDLAKKETPYSYSRRMKMNKSYPEGLDKKQRPICPPTKVISKRQAQARGSFGGLVSKMTSRSLSNFQLNSCRVHT